MKWFVPINPRELKANYQASPRFIYANELQDQELLYPEVIYLIENLDINFKQLKYINIIISFPLFPVAAIVFRGNLCGIHVVILLTAVLLHDKTNL